MTFDEFAETAQKREVRVFGSAYPFEVRYYVLGLIGDAGEVADKVTKIYGDSNGDISVVSPQAHDAIMYELGDVLWYINAIAVKLGRRLEEVARMNVEKLDDRERRGVIKGPVGAPRSIEGRPTR
jgi:NTP pyrophosphatase (non-canonical NTP hydrolase)